MGKQNVSYMKTLFILLPFLFIGPKKKNCGLIVEQGTYTGWDYWIMIENDQTHNKRIFVISEKEWLTIDLKNRFCVDSLDYW